MTTLEFWVNEDHIKYGRKGSIHSCPVALALRSIYDPDIEIQVGTSTVYLIYRSDNPFSAYQEVYYTEPYLSEQIMNFDQDLGQMIPGKYTLYDKEAYEKKFGSIWAQ